MNITKKNILILLWAVALPVASMRAASNPSTTPLPVSTVTRPEEIKQALTNAGIATDVTSLVCEYDVAFYRIKPDIHHWVDFYEKNHSTNLKAKIPEYCPITEFQSIKSTQDSFAVHLFHNATCDQEYCCPITGFEKPNQCFLVYTYDISTRALVFVKNYSLPFGKVVRTNSRATGKQHRLTGDTTIGLPSQDPYLELLLTDGNTLCLSAKIGAEEFEYWLKCPVKTSISSSSSSSSSSSTSNP